MELRRFTRAPLGIALLFARRDDHEFIEAFARDISLTGMFSSCPLSAFVAGEKRGGSNRSLSRNPAGSVSPARVPEARYSFHAEPLR